MRARASCEVCENLRKDGVAENRERERERLERAKKHQLSFARNKRREGGVISMGRTVGGWMGKVGYERARTWMPRCVARVL